MRNVYYQVCDDENNITTIHDESQYDKNCVRSARDFAKTIVGGYVQSITVITKRLEFRPGTKSQLEDLSNDELVTKYKAKFLMKHGHGIPLRHEDGLFYFRSSSLGLDRETFLTRLHSRNI